jgi:amicyanin
MKFTAITAGLAFGALFAGNLAFAACANPNAPPEMKKAEVHEMKAMTAMPVTAADPAMPGAPMPAANIVKIENFTFNAPVLTVPVGTTVTWTNVDDVPHTVVSNDKKTFRSHVLDTDQSFSFTFTTAGTYPYFCSLHPHMTGKIVVK